MLLRYISVFCIFALDACNTANILVAENLPSPSHQIFNYAIANELLLKGHTVTLLGPLTIKPLNHQNFTHIILEDINAHQVGDETNRMSDLSPLGMVIFYAIESVNFCNFTYSSPGFKRLLNYPDDYKFDAIIMDQSTDACFLPLIQRFGYPPTIAVSAFPLMPWIAPQFGNDYQPAYVPNSATLFPIDMNFFQRVLNYFYYYADVFIRRYYLDGQFQQLFEGAIGAEVRSVAELRKHVCLYLVSWSPVLHHPQPLAQNTIPVAGMHITQKPLDKDLQRIMGESKNGVILFSLGSNLRSDQLSLEKRKELLKTFAKLKQTVLWKFESDISELPDNVIVRKWIPQNDILAHQNTKLFISHAGGLSTIEASYFGVPILGMPFFGDQHDNIGLMVQKGVGRALNFNTLTSQELLDNINEILNNPEYSTKMKKLSSLMRDQLRTPKETTVFWIEYAIRNNGANLDPRSRHLPLIVSSCMDIKLFLTFMIVAFFFILRRLIRFVTGNSNDLKLKGD